MSIVVENLLTHSYVGTVEISILSLLNINQYNFIKSDMAENASPVMV